ncbi:hypothetical protein [Goodfellowiella coeruleoviolacea]|uniref:Uncharacterized protein n=1 Tax=Goodfellowiella coeruleoviolacea TaxID=334858 RepID=A0AAE3GGU8_9PSEU|nr:hypothetical protein [Goodfellowiella coeruleoviolacea]MCP2167448.1 hypothetical protein [Goodfellowiella coeruleoviolacea]
MLVSLTRVGGARQRFDKAFAVLGVEPATMARAFAAAEFRIGGKPAPVVPVEGTPGLFALRVPMSWLGSRPARDDLFADLADATRRLAEIARRTGGSLAAAGIATTGHAGVLGGDVHVVEVLSPVEQEVLCNLLRSRVPALIAMAGRGVTGVGRPVDRTGSRWLAGSRSHLATRFLASTTDEHLDRVKAELRRRDGVAQLDRMDVSPNAEPDGTLTVVVRCLDAAATLAGARAHALVLGALATRARRMVRDGRRTGHEPQRLLEENRARAVADGLRARLAVEERGPARRGTGDDRGAPAEKRRRPARDVVRAMVTDVAVELRNLDASAEELAPVLLALDLPDLGVKRGSAEADLLAHWADGGDAHLLARCVDALTDAAPGGPLLAALDQTFPGRVAVVMGTWRKRIAEARVTGPERQPARPNHGGRGDRRGGGKRSGRQRGDRREGR